MKILFIFSGNNRDKISPIVKNQGLALTDEGESVEYFSIEGKGLAGYIRSAIKLRKRLRTSFPDILHAHYGLSGLVALYAKRREKLVVSFMGDDLLGSNRSDGSVTTVSKILSRLNIYVANRYYDFVIVKSEEMFNLLTCKNRAIIPNGVNLEEFFPMDKAEARRVTGLGNDERIALFIGSPERKEKNHSLAINAVKLSGFKNLRLLTVSNIDQKQLKFYYNSADLLLLTSFHEGSPNVVKESMACNCPVVSTDVGDVKYLIKDVVGCYIAQNSADDFSLKIDQALNLGVAGVRSEGRDYIIKLGLDNKTFAKRLIRVYNSLFV